MEPPAIPDIITVVGSRYFQPIADLIEIMLSTPQPESSPSGAGWRENGYAASITILLVAVLESYTARLRFVRNDEISAPRNVPDLLAQLFQTFHTMGTCSRCSSFGTSWYTIIFGISMSPTQTAAKRKH